MNNFISQYSTKYRPSINISTNFKYLEGWTYMILLPPDIDEFVIVEK